MHINILLLKQKGFDTQHTTVSKQCYVQLAQQQPDSICSTQPNDKVSCKND